MHRRIFLGGAVAAAAGAAVVTRGRGRSSRWRFFTDEEAVTVDALCEQLIPADVTPGARAARVVNYIDIQLTRHLRKHQKTYRTGIAAIEADSRSRFGKPFSDLAADQQESVLQNAEENSRPFFGLLLAHCRQGFYGDPRHGGNYNMASWKMLGIAFPPVRGRAHYDDPSKVSE